MLADGYRSTHNSTEAPGQLFSGNEMGHKLPFSSLLFLNGVYSVIARNTEGL